MKKVEEVILQRTKKTSLKSKNSKTGYKGVSYQGDGIAKPYRARFVIESVNKKHKVSISLGMYETPQDAYLARIKFIDSLK